LVLPCVSRIPVPFDPPGFFRHAIGITVERSMPVKVLLEFLKPLHELVLTEPLHASQRTVKNTPEWVRVSLEVQLHEEFYLRLMGYGPYLRVIRPLSLRRRMREWYERGGGIRVGVGILLSPYMFNS
jgi:hypothetical protein